jgi:hypothetical protein
MGKKAYINLYFLFFMINCIFYNHSKLDRNLFFVFATYRHGARASLNKVDLFGNEIKYPGGLTKYGHIQHLEIGRNYRKRYFNFLNLSYDKNEIYIRSSDIPRVLMSTIMELEGLFNKTINRSDIQKVYHGGNFWNLYHLNDTEHKIMVNYYNYCKKKRLLGPNYSEILKENIFPILKDCFNMTFIPKISVFCDSVFTAYFEYKYGNDTKNKISKCGNENPKKFYDFCYDTYNSLKGWNEYGGYIFYKLFQHIFKHMDNSINKRSPLKMIMIGGHDNTLDKFMDFLNGMRIIPRTHYPHYACNIVIELRKYKDDYYLEFYYNDILKYNNTFETFKKILNNSKYSNLSNYCGLSLLKQAYNNTIKDLIDININYQNEKQKKDIITKNEINKKEKFINQKTFNKTYNINGTNKQLYYNKSEPSKVLIINQRNGTSSNDGTQISFKMKLKKIYEQEDIFKIYIIIICILTIIIIITTAAKIIRYILKKRKKNIIRLMKEQNNINNNFSANGVFLKEDQ